MNRFKVTEQKNKFKAIVGSVDSKLLLDFVKEVNNYADNLSNGTMNIKGYSLNTILAKYENLSFQDLQSRGLNKFRARAISKNTFKELLEKTLTNIN